MRIPMVTGRYTPSDRLDFPVATSCIRRVKCFWCISSVRGATSLVLGPSLLQHPVDNPSGGLAVPVGILVDLASGVFGRVCQ